MYNIQSHNSLGQALCVCWVGGAGLPTITPTQNAQRACSRLLSSDNLKNFPRIDRLIHCQGNIILQDVIDLNIYCYRQIGQAGAENIFI